MRTIAAITLGLTGLATLLGCTGSGPPHAMKPGPSPADGLADEPVELPTDAGSDPTHGVEPGDRIERPSVTLADLIHPPTAGAGVQKRYDVSDEIGANPIGEELRTITAPDEAGVWTVRTAHALPDGTTGAERITALQRSPTGAIEMLWVVTPEDSEAPASPDARRRAFAFEPPLTLTPLNLVPGERLQYTSEMIERDPQTGESGSLRGVAEREVYLLDADERRRLFPGIANDGPAVVAVMDVRFGPVTDRRWIVSIADPAGDRGIVAEHSEERRTFMGLGGGAEIRRYMLTEFGPRED